MYKSVNYERHRTRDLLLDYDISITPLYPRAAGLAMIYPWENLNLSMLSQQLFALAANNGFEGTQKEFEEKFGSFLQNKEIVYDQYDNFPLEGDLNKLYFDLNDKILYYWDETYSPVNTLLIENTTLDGGHALEE